MCTQGRGLAGPSFIAIVSLVKMPSVTFQFSLANRSALLEELASLGPESQGDVDETILRENLERTPAQRLIEASRAATQVEELQAAMRAAQRG